jgi:hypothetical protein
MARGTEYLSHAETVMRHIACRLIPIGQSQLVRAGVVMLSSMTPIKQVLMTGIDCVHDSWIQGHPEYGFGFKALVCHDGVRTSIFVVFFANVLRIRRSDRSLTPITMATPPTSCFSYVLAKTCSCLRVTLTLQFNHDWGGRPWDPQSRALSEL